ncbi:T12C22.21 PROTEIN [Salix koriyanagi]|uniref:T12C22.21 PROTEIN n=1 Tax=Salix koriyanagi TaxID=2511006 RepID=A0A9Q0TDK1_9ROSI|nr:T12C22.21 PROTEIN [Salix koriyanagi]
MLLLSQAPRGALSAKRRTPLKFAHQNPPLFFNSTKPKFNSRKQSTFPLTLAKPEGGLDSTSATKQSLSTNNPTPSPSTPDDTVFVGQEDVPLEGVIQFEKPTSSGRLEKWGRVALLAGGDVLALLLFSAIGRFGHGFSVFDFETLRTADPFIAGWFLGAYFLGGYGDDGRGMNGLSKAVIAATKSWATGITVSSIFC